MNNRPITLLLLAVLLHSVPLSSCVYRVYIRRSQLHSYFEGTEYFERVNGSHVDIIRHGSTHDINGTLQLTMDVDEGSGMLLLMEENPLPPIPNHVEDVTISWHANEVVNYSLEIEASPSGHFRMLGRNVSAEGVIPQEKSGFKLSFDCDPASTGKGQLNVYLTTTLNSTGEQLTANFHLDKICEGMLNSSVGGSGMMTTDMPISLFVTPSRSLPSGSATSTTRIRSFPSSNSLLMPYSTSEEPFDAQPSLTSSGPSSSLDVVFMMFTSMMQSPSPSPSPSPSLSPSPSPSSGDSISGALTTSSDSSSSFFTKNQQPSSPVIPPSPSLSAVVASSPFELPSSPSQVLSPSSSLSSMAATSSIEVPMASPSAVDSPSPSIVAASSPIDLQSSSPPAVVPPSPSLPAVVASSPFELPSSPSPALSPSPSLSSMAATSSMEVPMQSPSVVDSPSPSLVAASSPIDLQSSSPPAVVPPSSSLSSSLQPVQSSPDLVPLPSSQVPLESSTIELETPLSSSAPLPTNTVSGEKVNGTDTDRKSQLGDLLFIAFAPVVAILALSICILFCCVCCCIVKRRRKYPTRVFSDDPLDLPVRYSREVTERELEESFSKNAGPPLTLWMTLAWGTVSTLPAGVQSIIKHYTVDRRSLSILSNVAREDYGAIVRGQWCDPVCGDRGVRMKMLTGFQKQYGHRDEIVHFVELATLLRGRDHPNLQKVLKVSVEDNYIPLIIYPIVEYGNLHQFLTFCRSSPSESPLNPVTNQYKVNFSYQIVSALSYLCEEGIVHPDIALRNCLLDTNYSVKVSDGALAQLFFPECYSNVKGTVRPVRWAAIETLHHGQLNSVSNVWSYGVTVWEIMTLAEMPYPDLDNNRSVLSCLMMGQRLAQPKDCPDDMYGMMMSCWDQDPSRRPSFDQLRAHVFDVSGRYTPLPALDNDQSIPSIAVLPADGSGHNTPPTRNGTVQYHPVPVQPVVVPQYEPVVYDEPYVVNRQVSGSSLRSRESLQPDKLSITFSVLSEDVLGEGDRSSGESSGEEEEGGNPELIDVLDPNLLDKFMPSMRREQRQGRVRDNDLNDNSQRATLSPVSTVMGSDLEDTLKYSRLPHTVLSPGPFSTSTMTSRLSPCETHSCSSSQYEPSTVRSDETPIPGVSSPSPDLTSKTSTIGDETLSIASNPLLTTVYHSTPLAPPPAAVGSGGDGTLGKMSAIDSRTLPISSTNDGYPPPPDLVFTPRLNGSQYNGTENGTMNGRDSHLSNGHPPGTVNGDVIKNTQSPPTQSFGNHDDSLPPLDSKDSTLNGVVLREGIGGRQASRDSQLSRTSFGLGLGDLSSDLMSAFDTWKT